MQIQHSGISCGVLTFPGLEAGERIIMRHKYSIFNSDKYKQVPIIFLILHERKQYAHSSTKDSKPWQI